MKTSFIQFYKTHSNNTIDIMVETYICYITTCEDPPSKIDKNIRLQINNSLRQTTFSVINESVTSIFKKLQSTRHAESTWIPKIILNITTPLFFSSFLPSTMSINITDIAPFLQAPSFQLGIVFRHELSYPEICTFYLEGYHGAQHSKELTSNIITSA